MIDQVKLSHQLELSKQLDYLIFHLWLALHHLQCHEFSSGVALGFHDCSVTSIAHHFNDFVFLAYLCI
jgi:hypothetical protein